MLRILALIAMLLPLSAVAQTAAERSELSRLNQAGVEAYGAGDYGQAVSHFEQAYALTRRSWPEDDPEALTILNNIAELYRTTGRYAEAEPLYQRALEARERVLGPEHPDTLTSVNNLALLYDATGRYAEAEPLYQRALEASERVLGPEHPVTLASVNNLAILYKDTGRYADAEPLYLRALEVRERVLGPEHPDTLGSVNNLAILYDATGRYAEAEPLYQRALEAFERVLGPEHPDTLTTVNNLAELYRAAGRYIDAEPLYLSALEVRERVLGLEHPDTLQSVNNLAGLYWATGRYAEAEPLYLRVLEASERVLGPEHPYTLLSANNLAELYLATGRYAEAEPLYLRALEASEQVLGPEHPYTLTSVNNLAGLYQATGRYAEAEPLYLRALEVRERVLGPEHPDTLTSVNNLAGLYDDTGRYAEAEPLYLRALEASERVLGPEHPDTLISVNNLAGLYWATGRYAEAEPLLERALEAFKRLLGPEHPDTLTSVNNLAMLRLAGERPDAVAVAVGDLDQALGAWTNRVGEQLRAGAGEGLRDDLARNSSLRDVAASAALAFPEHGSLGARALLMTKGIAGETDAALSRLVASAPRPEVRETADALRVAEGALFASFQTNDPERIQAARRARDAARAVLFSLIDPPLVFRPEATTPQVITEALAPGEMFLDYGIFQPADFDTGNAGAPRILLAAYRSGHEVALFDLGPVGAILPAILSTTDAGPRTDATLSDADWRAWQHRVLADHAALTTALLGQVTPWLRDAASVTISPDGILTRVNFATLQDPSAPWATLSERLPVRTLPSGRSLLQPVRQDRQHPALRTAFLGVGLTDFGPYDPELCTRNRSVRAEGGLCPLPNAVKEVRQIRGLFGGDPATDLLEADATEPAVTAAMPGARFVHLATHGGVELAGYQGDGLNNVGLALHGAGQTKNTGPTIAAANDGILTGAEVARLSMPGTELVVMSACDTALGQDAGAEGVWSRSQPRSERNPDLGHQRRLELLGLRTIRPRRTLRKGAKLEIHWNRFVFRIGLLEIVN